MIESLRLVVDRREKVAIIRTDGYLNKSGGEEFSEAAQELFREGYDNLLFDLAKTRITNKHGLEHLVEIIEVNLEYGGSLAICHLTPTIEKTMHILGIAQYLEIFPDETSALRYLTNEAPSGVELRVTKALGTGDFRDPSWSRDGFKFVAVQEGTVTLWDSSTLEKQGVLAIGSIYSTAWSPCSPRGWVLAAGFGERSLGLWNAENLQHLRDLEGHTSHVTSLAFSPDGRLLASGSADKTVRLWDTDRWQIRQTFQTRSKVIALAFSPAGDRLAWSLDSSEIEVLDVFAGTSPRSLSGQNSKALSLAFSPDGGLLVSGSGDSILRVWDRKLQLTDSLEAHTAAVGSVSFSHDGLLLASRADTRVLLWDVRNRALVAELYEGASSSGLAFHPQRLTLATSWNFGQVLHLWDLDPAILLRETKQRSKVRRHITAKIVLVGDSGVGKTGLGWRLAHGDFKEHPSTHGQQFWVLDAVGLKRGDGTECEAVLWDLAGQPDYRLIHALFLDDTELALVLFDPSGRQETLQSVDFWLKALRRSEGRPCPAILVGARLDRGEPAFLREELTAFCQNRGISGDYIGTSALSGEGLEDLLHRIRSQIAWEDMAATTTTKTFKRIKEHVLGLKESSESHQLLTDPEGLRSQLENNNAGWRFTDAEMMTAVGHLAKHGFVRVLRTSSGDRSILLAPDLLNNLAASIVLEARRNPRGLGALEEGRLLAGGYEFPELVSLTQNERHLLLDSAAVLFVENNVCFRESSLGSTTFLIFPELIHRKKPLLADEVIFVDDVSYTVSGAVENVYSALVVLLGYTSVFRRTDQWQGQAQYDLGDEICGFRQLEERQGEIDFVLYYGPAVRPSTRLLFQGLFERFLAGRNVTVTRYPSLACPNEACGYRQERALVVRRIREGDGFLFCSKCGQRVELPKAGEEIEPDDEQRRRVDGQQATAHQRTRFEASLVQLMAYAGEHRRDSPAPTCFVSYAWGHVDEERWVERSLATDLRKASIQVILDRWDNAAIGSSLPRFVEEIEGCNFVLLVGTPLYLEKYNNKLSTTGSTVAAEVDLINQRLLRTEDDKKTVLPIVLDGDEESSLPPLVRGRVYADFRREDDYFLTLFDLVLTIYGIPFESPSVYELRESLRQENADPPRFGRAPRAAS